VKWKPSPKAKEAWLCPGWEVAAGFCTAFEEPEAQADKTREEAVAQACKRLGTLAGLGEETSWAFLKQVHGVALQKAQGLKPGQALCLGEADGVWTEQPGVALAVQTADCVPVLLLDKRRRRVAAVHAGWRGVWGRILPKQLELWAKEGSLPGDIQVALGPCIGPCCYEVSPELAKQFSTRWEAAVLPPREGAGPRVDLAKALEQDMLEAGVLPEKLQKAQVCTFCDGRFYSHRRTQGGAGRQISWVLNGLFVL